MAQETNIAWCDLSWNPVHGCSRVSTGCKHCYAETLSLRYGQTPKPWTALQRGGERDAEAAQAARAVEQREGVARARRCRAAAGKTDGMLVFVNSMSDLFHEQIPDEYIAQVFASMAMAPAAHVPSPDEAARADARRCSATSSGEVVCRRAVGRCATELDLTLTERAAAPERLAGRVDREPQVGGPRGHPARDAGGGAVHQRGAAARAAVFDSTWHGARRRRPTPDTTDHGGVPSTCATTATHRAARTART